MKSFVVDNPKENIISEYKNFIYKYTCQVCNKKLDWKNDDQLSIAMIAFNEALDKYNPQSKKSFLEYSKLVIKNRLIDFFRKENTSKVKVQYFEETENSFYEESPLEIEAAWEKYLEEAETQKQKYQIDYFANLLKDFRIDLKELISKSPIHKKTRENLHKLALKISENDHIVDKLYKNKKLPIKDIRKLTGASNKQLEKWRKYLIALIVAISQKELTYLKKYINNEW